MTYKDKGGNTVLTPDNKPPTHGTPVKIVTGSGTVPATMVGGTAVRDK